MACVVFSLGCSRIPARTAYRAGEGVSVASPFSSVLDSASVNSAWR